MTDDIPRRCQLHLMTPPENAIYNAMCVVEQAGCDVRLTEAVNLLQKARDRVADFVDGVEHPLVSYPKSEPEVLLQVIAEREDWRMREGRAQHEKALAQKRIKSLEDGIVAENKRTSVIEQELQAVKDVLIARDEDFHPEGLVSVAVVVARILNERDQADERASTATDVLCGALGPDHGRGGLVEHCQKAAEKIAELERDFATLAALNKSNADELARQMDLRERGVPAPRFTDSRQQAIAEAVLYSDCLRRSEGEEVAAKAKLAELRADQRATGDVLAAILGRERCEDGNVRLANDVALKVEGIEDQIRSVRSAVDALALYVESGFSNKNSGGSGAAQADVAQRGQSNEGTHGPLDRPASPEPAGGLCGRCKGLGKVPSVGTEYSMDRCDECGGAGMRKPPSAADCETKLVMSRAELSRTRVAFRNFVREYELCVPRSARLSPRMVSAEKKLDDLFLHVIEPAAPESITVTAKRDADWIWAIAQALGTDSGFNVPIVPDVEAFRKLFEAVRAKEWDRIFGGVKPVDIAEANGGYCTKCRLLRRICGGEAVHEKEEAEEAANPHEEATASPDAAGGGGRGRAEPPHAPHEPPPVEASARLTCTRCGGTGKVRQFVSYGEGETQGAYANESPCPACASQPVATFKTRSVHPGWAEPPKPYTKPKLTELVSREQLIAACKSAALWERSNTGVQSAFEALIRALEG